MSPLPVRRFNPPKIKPRPRPTEDRLTIRRAWLTLLEDAGKFAERLAISDGEEMLEPVNLRHALARLDAHSFPPPGSSAQGAAYAFLLQLRATLDAGLPRTRAVLAPALAASAKALDTLLNDERVSAAEATWKRGDD